MALNPPSDGELRIGVDRLWRRRRFGQPRADTHTNARPESDTCADSSTNTQSSASA